ncbi:MAG: chemotaxis protein, partial [Bradyrhizobium sp.]
MSVKRKRFRVEQAMGEVVMPEPEVAGGADLGPMHREIMAELRSIRAQMAAAPAQRSGDSVDAAVAREVAETQALLETYRAQVEQCEKLKVELDLIH